MGPSGKCVSGFHRTSPSLLSSGQPPVCGGGTAAGRFGERLDLPDLLNCRPRIQEVDTMPAATCGTSERPAVDPDRFRTLMRRFATGVTVVTCPGPDGPEGITVNAFTSVSLRPPQVLVCLDRRSRTLPTMLTAGRFAVNVLGWEQRELATRLAEDADACPAVRGDPRIHPGDRLTCCPRFARRLRLPACAGVALRRSHAACGRRRGGISRARRRAASVLRRRILYVRDLAERGAIGSA
jgi:hypothetical protein